MRGFISIAVVLLAACGPETAGPQAHGATPPDAAAPERQLVGNAESGKQLVETYACGACHRIPGVAGAEGALGPSLAGIGSRTEMTTGVPITPETMVAYLQNPPAIDPQTRMPPLGVSEEEARHMTAYLFTLR